MSPLFHLPSRADSSSTENNHETTPRSALHQDHEKERMGNTAMKNSDARATEEVMSSSLSSSYNSRSPSFILKPRKPHSRNDHQDSGNICSSGNGGETAGASDGNAHAASSLSPFNRFSYTVTPPEEKFPSADKLNINRDTASASSFISPSKSYPPTPLFTQFRSSGNSKNRRRSPIKKQKTLPDRFGMQHPYPSPDTSFSEHSYDSCDDYNSNSSISIVPSFPSMPSSPSLDQISSNGKRSFPSDGNNDDDRDRDRDEEFSSTSPFTPQCRGMMQKLNINSPPLTSASPTPESCASIPLPPHHLPNVPTFSFSPSINLEKKCGGMYNTSNNDNNNELKFDTIESSARGGASSSVGTTYGTPSRSGVSSSTNSPFHPCVPPGQRTHMRHHSGSSFKMLPPRLHQLSGGAAAAIFSNNIVAGPMANSNHPNDTSFSSSSSYSASPSPRVVPLTVLSRNGSPVVSPKIIGSSSLSYASSQQQQLPTLTGINFGGTANAPSSSLMYSPLMRSLDQVAKDDKEFEDAEDRHYEEERIKREKHNVMNLGSPKLGLRLSSLFSDNKHQVSPLIDSDNTTRHHPILPKIKLTPRSQKNKIVHCNFASLMLDSTSSSPPLDDMGDGLSMTLLMPLNDTSSGFLAPKRGCVLGKKKNADANYTKRNKSFMCDKDDDKKNAEMDCLLSGFEHHNAGIEKNSSTQLPRESNNAKRMSNHDKQDETEGDDAEMVELTNGSLHLPTLWLPATQHQEPTNSSSGHLSGFSCSDGDTSYSSVDNQKSKRHSIPPRAPMPSITLRCFAQSGSQSNTPSRNNAPVVNAGFLPRPLPMAQNKCRSLFDTTSSSNDPLTRILRADAIAEAARSNEPLTDDDSDAEGGGFFLSSPSLNSVNRSNHVAPSKTCPKNGRKSSFGSKEYDFAAKSLDEESCSKSPLSNEASPRTSNLAKFSKLGERSFPSASSVTACTITEEPCSLWEQGEGKSPFFSSMHSSSNSRGTPDTMYFASLCSLSDCDSSDVMTSPKYPRKKPPMAAGLKCADFDNKIHHVQHKDRASVCSFLSMSSLHGLDIVHESSMGDEMNNNVPIFLPSESSEFLMHHGGDDMAGNAIYFRPMRSELSLNSLGLSVDSNADSSMDQRDLSTPTPMCLRSNKSMLSPPPLRSRSSHLIDRG